MTITIPESPAELEEFMADDKKVKAAYDQDGGLATLIKNYAQTVAAKDPGLAQQIKEQTQATLAQMYEEQGVPFKNRINLNYQAQPPKSARVRNSKAAGRPLDNLFGSTAEFLHAIWHGNKNPDADTRAALEKVYNYSEKVPSEGGFLVPEEFRSELMIPSLGEEIVRPRATVVPMSSATLRFPKVDETSRVSSVFGGVIVYRTEEAAELVESAAAFGAVRLEATKQTLLAHVSNELIKDWPAFEAFISQTFGPAIGFYADMDFLSGTGVGEPKGALHSSNAAIVSVAKESGQLAATLLWENIIKMYARMLPSSLPRAVWLASPDVFAELATMALNVGTGGSAVWLVDAHNQPVLTLLGRPVIMTEKAPAVLGTRGDLSFVDFGMYLIGDRQMMTASSSEHVKFTSDRTTYRVIARNDGRPWVENAITPRNNSADLSPFVQLDTRA